MKILGQLSGPSYPPLIRNSCYWSVIGNRCSRRRQARGSSSLDRPCGWAVCLRLINIYSKALISSHLVPAYDLAHSASTSLICFTQSSHQIRGDRFLSVTAISLRCVLHRATALRVRLVHAAKESWHEARCWRPRWPVAPTSHPCAPSRNMK